jgi:Mg/Co/Ni transporter MgtE
MGTKMAEGEVKLEQPLQIPAYTLPAGAILAKGQILPDDVKVQVKGKNGAMEEAAFVSAGTSEPPSAYGKYWMRVGLTVLVALIGVVCWGSLAGSMLPFILRRLGFDPATSSAPFVATLVDVTGLIIYFVVAKVILTGTVIR